jgi:hypothetical protein
MDGDSAFDLLAHSDRLGEPYEALTTRNPDAPAHEGVDLHPMTEEQAAYLAHLMRRIGRVPGAALLTFGQAKAKIAELLDELTAR